MMTPLASTERGNTGAVRRLHFTRADERRRVGILLKANTKEDQAFRLRGGVRSLDYTRLEQNANGYILGSGERR
jgi:hypothetical protein